MFPRPIPPLFFVSNIIKESKHDTQDDSKENTIKTTHPLTKHEEGVLPHSFHWYPD